MALNSLLFITKFLPIIILLYFLVPKKYKNSTLLLISLALYAFASPKYVLLLFILIVINYFFGFVLHKKQGKHRKQVLIEIIIINIFILGYFKYYETLLDAIVQIVNVDITFTTLIAPLGISFFILQLIAYQIDIYRKNIKPQVNFISFALAISFFPKIIMGPIIDYKSWQQQVNNHPFSSELFNFGAKRFIIGLGQKVILANTFGVLWNTLQKGDVSMASAWLGIIAFSFQLYFDFAGYSHMAIGLANIFGFRFDENFNYPYSSRSISEFWRRWHISLGRWFKEYVYIPLGGNRVSKTRHIMNLFIVWILTGLWHGANLTFIVWGLYFAVMLVIEKYYLYRKREEWSKAANLITTYIMVLIGWVFFASNDIGSALQYLGKMIDVNTIGVIDYSTLWYIVNYAGYFIIAVVASLPIASNVTKLLSARYPKTMSIVVNVGLLLIVFISLAFMVSSNYQSFIYAKF